MNDMSEDDRLTVSGGHSMCPFEEFIDVDENLITALYQEMDDITAKINGGDKDKEDTTTKIPPIHIVALEALETLQDFFQFNTGNERNFSHLELEKIMFESSQKQK